MGTEKLPDRFREALGDVEDPEFPVSVVDLGIIYDIEQHEDTVEVSLTFTSTGCPAVDWIKQDVRERLLEFPDVNRVDIEVVWDPPWTPERLSEKAKAELPGWGVSP